MLTREQRSQIAESLTKRSKNAKRYSFSLSESYRSLGLKKQHKAKVDSLFAFSPQFQTLENEYIFFKPMLVQVLNNELWPARYVMKPLGELEEKDGDKIGRGLASCLATNTTAEAAVDEWMLQYPSLVELEATHDWFRPLMVDISKSLLRTAPYGAVLRTFIAACLSLLDMVTDLYVGVEMAMSTSSEQRALGYTLITMVLLCIFACTFIVLVQNRKQKKRVMIQEILLVVLGLKPAADAYRVASGNVWKKGLVMDPITEMLYTKLAELTFEAIPGTALQMLALLFARLTEENDGPVETTVAIASLAVSAFNAGYIAAQISFDKDTDPSKRRETPTFFGMLPDGSKRRLVSFSCMIAMSSTQLLGRSMAIYLFYKLSPVFTVIYIATDFVVYYTYVTASGNLHYWLPIPGWTGFLYSIVQRFCVKIAADFTFLVYLRHPYEMTGLYFTVNVVVGQLLFLASALVYVQHLQGTSEERIREKTDLVLGLTAAIWTIWFVALMGFLLLIKEPFRKTFVSMQTGPIFTCKNFENALTDEAKKNIVTIHRKHWVSLEEDVKNFTMSNWMKWEEEEPGWFTAGWIEHVDDDLIPNSYLDRLKMTVSLRMKSGRKRSIDYSVRGMVIDEGRAATSKTSGCARVAPMA